MSERLAPLVPLAQLPTLDRWLGATIEFNLGSGRSAQLQAVDAALHLYEYSAHRIMYQQYASEHDDAVHALMRGFDLSDEPPRFSGAALYNDCLDTIRACRFAVAHITPLLLAALDRIVRALERWPEQEKKQGERNASGETAATLLAATLAQALGAIRRNSQLVAADSTGR